LTGRREPGKGTRRVNRLRTVLLGQTDGEFYFSIDLNWSQFEHLSVHASIITESRKGALGSPGSAAIEERICRKAHSAPGA